MNEKVRIATPRQVAKHATKLAQLHDQPLAVAVASVIAHCRKHGIAVPTTDEEMAQLTAKNKVAADYEDTVTRDPRIAAA